MRTLKQFLKESAEIHVVKNPKTGREKFYLYIDGDEVASEDSLEDIKDVADWKFGKKHLDIVKENETLKEDTIPMDWLRELMKDVKWGEGWCTIDYIQWAAEQELDINLWNQEKEIKDAVNKLGFGSILKEEHRMKTFKEALKEAKLDSHSKNIQLFDYQGILMDVIPQSGKIGFRVGNWFIPLKNVPSNISSDIYSKEADKYCEEMTDRILKEVLPAAQEFENAVKRIVQKY